MPATYLICFSYPQSCVLYTPLYFVLHHLYLSFLALTYIYPFHHCTTSSHGVATPVQCHPLLWEKGGLAPTLQLLSMKHIKEGKNAEWIIWQCLLGGKGQWNGSISRFIWEGIISKNYCKLAALQKTEVLISELGSHLSVSFNEQTSKTTVLSEVWGQYNRCHVAKSPLRWYNTLVSLIKDPKSIYYN